MTASTKRKFADPEMEARTQELHGIIMQLMDHELEHSTTIRNIVRAINQGVGERYILELQSLYYGKEYVLGITAVFPNEITDAIRDYRPKALETRPRPSV